MGTPRVVILATALLTLALPAPTVTVAADVKPAAAPASATRIADVDGDGRPDTVFRAADAADTEVVGVRLATGTVQTLTADQATGGANQVFGASLAIGDVNADGYADVLFVARATGAHQSSVWVLWGGPDGISAGRSKGLVDGIENESCALAFVPVPERVLVVGAPVADDAPGSADLYRLATDGSVTAHRHLVPGSSGVPGRASVGVEFGWGLAASGDLLAVGDPKYGSVGAGSVWVLKLHAGLKFEAVRVSQESRGIPGHSEESDGFGSSVSVLGDRVVVGSPGESIGRKGFAGAVTTFRVVYKGRALVAVAGRQVSQLWPGVPGVGGANHLFGAHVLAVRLCTGVPGAVVFAPGEQGVLPGPEGGLTQGRVVTVPFMSGRTCPGVVLGTHVASLLQQPLSVARLKPVGTPREAPVALTGTAQRVVVGTSAGGFTLPGLNVEQLAPPAA